jgi:hypothetical protein
MGMPPFSFQCMQKYFNIDLRIAQASKYDFRKISEIEAAGYRQIKDDCGKIKVKFMVTIRYKLKRLPFMI